MDRIVVVEVLYKDVKNSSKDVDCCHTKRDKLSVNRVYSLNVNLSIAMLSSHLILNST